MPLNTYCFEYTTREGDSDNISVQAHDLIEGWVHAVIDVLALARANNFVVTNISVSASWMADTTREGIVPMRTLPDDMCDFPDCFEYASHGVGVRGKGFSACHDHVDEINALAISFSRKKS